MRNFVVTFSGSAYHDTTKRIVEDAPKLGADDVFVFDDAWLRDCRPGYWDRVKWFREQRHAKEERPRGVDFFCFKPLYILDALYRCSPGDVILALDADTVPIAPLTPLFDRCRADGGIMAFEAQGCTNRMYVKRDAFILAGMDAPEFHDTQHAVARFLLLQKGGRFPAEQFVGEWLGLTANPMTNTFEPSVLGPELPGFKQGRCEQAILSLLCLRHGVRLYREACQFGAGNPKDQDIFPQTFEQHGRHSYDPGGHREGSRFRNVQD